MREFLVISMSFLDFMFFPMIVMMLGTGAVWLAARQFNWGAQPFIGRMGGFLWQNFFYQQVAWCILFVISIFFYSRGSGAPAPMLDDGSGVMWRGIPSAA